MNTQFKQAIVVLAFIVILPVVFFLLYEYSSINREEKLLTEGYDAQLNSILFSINLSSEDIISTWQKKILEVGGQNPSMLQEFISENSSIKLLYAKNLTNGNVKIIYNIMKPPHQALSLIDTTLQLNETKTTKLFSFLQAGYRKAEPVSDSSHLKITQILFASNDNGQKIIYGIAIDARTFIDKTLKPRFQMISQENLVVSIVDKRTNEKVFSNFITAGGEVRSGKTLWLLPDYEMAIAPLNTTVAEIVQNRKKQNFIIAGFLAFLLFSGALVLLNNIRKGIKLSEIKSEFVSNVSHELRTPLALISLFAESLSLGRVKSEEKKQEYYEIMKREIDRLSNIVNKILNFSQLESGKRAYNFEVTNLNVVVAKIVECYKFHLANKGFDLSVTKDETLPNIEAEHVALSEAIINLIDNAIKYSGDTKQVSIATGWEKDFVFVSVADKGIGISDENKKRIFDKFFRVPSNKQLSARGTGIGLSIVKEITLAHKGIIDVQSNPAEGSKFILKFKIQDTGNVV